MKSAFTIKVLYYMGTMMRFIWMSFFISISKNEKKKKKNHNIKLTYV